MTRVGKAVLLFVVMASLVTTIVASVMADPIHVPGGPRFDGGAILGGHELPAVSVDCLFTPIHVPGGP